MHSFEEFSEKISLRLAYSFEHQRETHTLEESVQDWKELFIDINKIIVDFGNASAPLLVKDTSLVAMELYFCYAFHFQWLEQAKSFQIFLRDLIFEAKKAELLLNENQVQEKHIEHHLKASHRLFEAAVLDFRSNIRQLQPEQFDYQRKGMRQIRKWRFQEIPWEVYKEHLTGLESHVHIILKEFSELNEYCSFFHEIRSQFEKSIVEANSDIKTIDDDSYSLLQKIEETLNEANDRSLNKVTHWVQETENSIKKTPYFNKLSSKLDETLQKLPLNYEFTILAQHGQLMYHPHDLRKKSLQWLESEIFPLMYEVWELADGISNGLKMTLINIRNRTTLLSNEIKDTRNPEIEKRDISSPLLNFRKEIQSSVHSIEDLKKLVHLRMSASFYISKIYGTPESFLDVGLQSTISQLKINQNRFLQITKKQIESTFQFVKNLRQSVEEEESLSTSEKVVRFIQRRKGDDTNSHYASIFLTKGYVGESFMVGRKEEIQHFDSIVKNWKLGYRGSVALLGQRLSGKSFFGEMIANRYFQDRILRLQPGQILRWMGRKFELSYDLGEALEFIRKHTTDIKPLIWIDDLELWWDPQIPMYENVRALKRHIDSNYTQAFYMVSLGKVLRSHLSKVEEIHRIFQAEIHMDGMTADEIREAILIRHGATHKKLLKTPEIEFIPQQFRSLTSKIHKESEGNIGDALNLWAASTKRFDEDHVMNTYSQGPSLPDFIQSDTALLLSSLILQKRSHEYRLRKLFGPAFNERYQPLLKRMYSVGLLQRQLDGWLEVNELTVNELGRLLERRQYLTYSK